jgi:DNA-binding transcriptional MerR regulator
MLEINNRIEKGNITPKKNSSGGHRVANQQDLDKLIEDYDKQVYGPSPKPILKEEEQEKYDARKEMEHLKEIAEHGGRGVVNLEGRNIPEGIVESILNNPLDLKPIDPRMDALEEKLKDNMPGIKAAANILERVEKQDQEARAKINENIIPKQNITSGVDYELIKTIIESTIDKKLSEINNTLNESVEKHQMYVPSMKILNFKDNFYFVDNDNNVFECVMKYKGKMFN